MRRITAVFVAIIAALHSYIAWLEIFAWETRAPKVFLSLPIELFSQTTALAANQGLYNGFLAAGLVWALLIKDVKWQVNVGTCFLLFVAVAGVFGAYTVTFNIIYIQTVPALITLGLMHFFRRA